MEIKKSTYIKLAIVIIFIIFILIAQLIIIPSIARFRKEINDEVRAYYTALYLDNDGDGKVVALEEDINNAGVHTGYSGTFSINISNFIGEDVTQRDITYKIYTKKEEVLYNEDEGYYILGIWNKHVPVQAATTKYNVQILGEGDSSATATVHQLNKVIGSNETPQGVTNNHIIKITRDTSSWEDPNNEVEKMSVIIETVEPYKDVFVIDLVISTKLIVFSTKTISKMGFNVKRLYIQTASSFKRIDYDTLQGYDPDCFKTTISWDGYYLDSSFERILKHASSDSISTDNINDIYLVSGDLANKTAMQLYIPAGSDFYIDFYYLDKGLPHRLLAYNELKFHSTGLYASYPDYPYDTIGKDPDGNNLLYYQIENTEE